MQRAIRAEPTPPECALAAEMFDHFCSAGTMKQILALHREICNTLNLKPTKLPDFYPKLKEKLSSSWKAQALFKKFDARASHKVYIKGRACPQTRVLIIGAGPCGLRAAIECQLLGAKVVVVEKRCQVSRNNVLHLWPFVIQDLRALGAKKFFGKFCAGSIDHISIRQLQCILLKVALLLGVELHEGVSFEGLLEPAITDDNETLGWRAMVTPGDHPVSHYEFDVLLGADGKRNTLQGFKRKEFRGKLAMAITANFINRHTEAEASVPEISGVAFIFNQKFFNDLNAKKGINLENIVYYNDDTHYFVMTVKKQSLLDKGVILQDYPDVARLLSVQNVDRSALMAYAQEAARFSTDGLLPLKDFALNHYGEPDVALFDFTSMYAAENASMVYERIGRRLLCQLVGDSLLEPFWPTGSGCARGFLSALDAAWSVRSWGHSPPPHPLHVIAERESIYRLLAQTTPENLSREFGGYTLDPGTRYPNLNRTAVSAHRVTTFYNSDEALPLDASASTRKRRRDVDVSEEVLLNWLGVRHGGLREAVSAHVLTSLLRRYRPDLLPNDQPDGTVYHVLHHEFGIVPIAANPATPSEVPETKLRTYLSRVYNAFKGEVPHVHHQTDVFDQIKQNQQKEKHSRNFTDHSVSAYTSAAEAEKSHSSNRKKRRALRASQVSNDPEEYIINKIGKLDLNDLTQLARLIEGHDAAAAGDTHPDKHRSLQEEILSLLDPDESPDPQVLRESLAQLLQGPSQMRVKDSALSDPALGKFFSIDNNSTPPVKPPRRLKGLDPSTIKYVDLSDEDDTLVLEARKKQPHSAKGQRRLKGFIKSNSIDAPAPPETNLLDIVQMQRRRNSDSPAVPAPSRRASSIGPSEVKNTRRIAEMFEDRKRHHATSPDPPRFVRPNFTPEKAERMQRMNDILEGKTRSVVSPDRSKPESIGHPELALRKQRVVELIEGRKPMEFLSPESIPRRKNLDELSFKLQRMSDMLHRPKPMDLRRQKGGTGRRKAAREIMKQRFEKSVQLLAAEPSMTLTSSLDLENDYGLQQYRASAPQFGDRVKKLERKLQHYEEGRLVGGGGRNLGNSGARVARLAAELSGSSPQTAVTAAASKPKDLLRSVGKIERDDWNVKKIEDKIMENRLGRPEPKTAERVPKWDKAQFLGRQRRLKEGDGSDEKYGEIDSTLSKLGQKLRDSGRPEHGTKKVASLANKFVKQEQTKELPKQEAQSARQTAWRGPASAGMQCAACGTRVFAAECVVADGLHVHRACFRCAICKAVLRPGNYSMERYGSRLVCLRHSGVSVPDAVAAITCPVTSSVSPKSAEVPAIMPERISVEASSTGKREIDEDEWTDRNFLASETSGAGGLSDSDESSSDEFADASDSGGDGNEAEDEQFGRSAQLPAELYHSDDSYGYDDYSDDGGDSSGNDSCSRMREALEARRREVVAGARPPTPMHSDSSVETFFAYSSESLSESSSGTEVSTDSEFEQEEGAPPPAILVTEPAPPVAPPAPSAPSAPPTEFALARARSTSGIATTRALQLKRKYLLGESSPTAVRKSDSTSQLDTKLEAFRSNITQFQKLLNPAPTPQTPTPVFQSNTIATKKPMPDIIINLLEDAPVDLLTGDVRLTKKEYPKINKDMNKNVAANIEYDSLSEVSSTTKIGENQPVPRVEVHDDAGDLIELDSTKVINSDEITSTTAPTTHLAQQSESSESCRDPMTLPLTEAELSDWAIDSHVLEDSIGEKDHIKPKNSRSLNGPKLVHDARNTSAIASHVCGRSSPNEPVHYNNALDHFEFADEGEEEMMSVENSPMHKNNAYGECGEEDYNNYSPVNDRSMNFIERSFSDTAVKPSQNTNKVEDEPKTPQPPLNNVMTKSTDSESTMVQSDITSSSSTASSSNGPNKLTNHVILEKLSENKMARSNPTLYKHLTSPPKIAAQTKPLLFSPKSTTSSSSFASPPIVKTPPKKSSPTTVIKFVSSTVCRSASETFHRPQTMIRMSPSSVEVTLELGSGSKSPVSPVARDTSHKVEELKRAREEQTEVVRRLVLARLGSGGRTTRKSARRSQVPPPVPPPPVPPVPPPPVEAPRPAPPLPVTPSFSDPELARERRRNTIIRSLSNYFNRHRNKWISEPDLTEHVPPNSKMAAHKSTGALEEAPPVPPLPARRYYLHIEHTHVAPKVNVVVEVERDPMKIGCQEHVNRLINQRRAREFSQLKEPAAMRVARLERKLSRPLSAEQQAATVAELVQVSAQRDAHQAMMAADRRRSAAHGGVCD